MPYDLTHLTGVLSQSPDLDPKALALMQAGFTGLQAAGPSRTPVSLGQIIGQAGEAGLNQYQAAQTVNMNRKAMMIRQKLLEAQAEQAAQQTSEHKADRDFFARPDIQAKLAAGDVRGVIALMPNKTSQSLVGLAGVMQREQPKPQPIGAGGLLMPDRSIIPPVTTPKPKHQAGDVRSRYEGELTIQEEMQSDGSWKEIGRGPRFARSVAPVVNVGQQQPRLKPGERMVGDRVEAIPGSDLYVSQSNKHGKDYGALQTVRTKTKSAAGKIDEILSETNKSAFNSNFGGYNAMLTQYIPGDTQNMKLRIESLKSDLKSAGLDIIRQGGGVGQMTEREWPIVERMIASIDPRLSENEARDTFRTIKTYLQRLADNAEDVYGAEWGNTQYYKGAKNTPSVRDQADAILKGK